jgi:hypothetical protein
MCFARLSKKSVPFFAIPPYVLQLNGTAFPVVDSRYRALYFCKTLEEVGVQTDLIKLFERRLYHSVI